MPDIVRAAHASAAAVVGHRRPDLPLGPPIPIGGPMRSQSSGPGLGGSNSLQYPVLSKITPETIPAGLLADIARQVWIGCC